MRGRAARETIKQKPCPSDYGLFCVSGYGLFCVKAAASWLSAGLRGNRTTYERTADERGEREGSDDGERRGIGGPLDHERERLRA